jgi:hypothetical protein
MTIADVVALLAIPWAAWATKTLISHGELLAVLKHAVLGRARAPQEGGGA